MKSILWQKKAVKSKKKSWQTGFACRGKYAILFNLYHSISSLIKVGDLYVPHPSGLIGILHQKKIGD